MVAMVAMEVTLVAMGVAAVASVKETAVKVAMGAEVEVVAEDLAPHRVGTEAAAVARLGRS